MSPPRATGAVEGRSEGGAHRCPPREPQPASKLESNRVLAPRRAQEPQPHGVPAAPPPLPPWTPGRWVWARPVRTVSLTFAVCGSVFWTRAKWASKARGFGSLSIRGSRSSKLGVSGPCGVQSLHTSGRSLGFALTRAYGPLDGVRVEGLQRDCVLAPPLHCPCLWSEPPQPVLGGTPPPPQDVVP